MHANPVIAGGIQGSPGNCHVAASPDRGRADSQSRGGTPDVDINPEAGGVARKHRYNYAIHRIGVGLSDRDDTTRLLLLLLQLALVLFTAISALPSRTRLD